MIGGTGPEYISLLGQGSGAPLPTNKRFNHMGVKCWWNVIHAGGRHTCRSAVIYRVTLRTYKSLALSTKQLKSTEQTSLNPFNTSLL
jgi:hypothetical protein